MIDVFTIVIGVFWLIFILINLMLTAQGDLVLSVVDEEQARRRKSLPRATVVKSRIFNV